jgi:hypothetical protein
MKNPFDGFAESRNGLKEHNVVARWEVQLNRPVLGPYLVRRMKSGVLLVQIRIPKANNENGVACFVVKGRIYNKG